MTILFDATRTVKTARHFGTGILATIPTYRADHTAADDAWLVADTAWLVADNARRDQEARRFDRLAAESAALDRFEAGLSY